MIINDDEITELADGLLAYIVEGEINISRVKDATGAFIWYVSMGGIRAGAYRLEEALRSCKMNYNAFIARRGQVEGISHE